MDLLSFILVILFGLFLLLGLVLPVLQHRRRRRNRFRLIRELERQRHSRVITLIHRQERISFLGIPLLRFIDMDDAVQVLRAVRLTSPEVPIDLLVHTPGGLLLPTQQIAYALKQHPAQVTVMVPHFAMSGGTLIALAADQILMDANAVLGPVDPQVGSLGQAMPATSILSVFELKESSKLDDSTLMMADIAAKALSQIRHFVYYLLEDKMGADRARAVAETMTSGYWTHDYPLVVPLLQQLELPVSTELPKEIYRLMELYPQPTERQPAVQYVPVPYRRGNEQERR